jgi:hypothetical protein
MENIAATGSIGNGTSQVRFFTPPKTRARWRIAAKANRRGAEPSHERPFER